MEKNLELTIRMDNDHVEIDIYEPESGECSQIDAPLSFDEESPMVFFDYESTRSESAARRMANLKERPREREDPCLT